MKYDVCIFECSICKEYKTKKEYLERLIENGHLCISNILHINSCCISYTNLVSRKTDALIISTNKPWDIMPGELLCKECGIKVNYLDFDKKVRLLTNNDEIKDKLFGCSKTIKK